MAGLPEMQAIIVEHGELKMAGIPCIGLKDMGSKYHNAKESLFGSARHFPQFVNPRVHYGMWPNQESQNNPDIHAYILSVEVSTFDGIPDWYVKLTVPLQKCVVVANKSGDFDAANNAVEMYIQSKHLNTDAGERKYTICERYSYDDEGFAKYSLPISEE